MKARCRASAAAPRWKRGYVHVYTGEGKGKTTAALGLALRAAGAGLRVYVAQFAKGRPTSEIKALKRFAGQIVLRQFGRTRFIVGRPARADIVAARRGLGDARRAMLGGRYQVVILDEANVAARLGLFPAQDLVDLIHAKPRSVELVITGRGVDRRVIRRADVVTEMRPVRHYYETGVKAREGIEF